MLFVSKAYGGHTHDFTIFKEIFADFDFSAFSVHVDSVFIGLEKHVMSAFIFRPYKAAKNNPLTDFQRAVNACLARFRVWAGHSIAKTKAFFSCGLKTGCFRKINWMMPYPSVLN
ncbi:transposase family protein [Hymenobacter sp. BRD67]|uniref:transposase family protein n=1 Tax=Hymenobacter sp. BRD67 TaxID=2675877 RepID=UPI003977D1AB